MPSIRTASNTASRRRGDAHPAQGRLRSVVALVAGALLVAHGLGSGQTPAEFVSTPHWQWPAGSAPRRVVFIVNSAAQREPAELAQRFPIEALAVPVSGSDYGNKFDEATLAQYLAASPAAIVVAASAPWTDLSKAAQDGLRASVESGVSLVIFDRAPKLPAWDGLAKEGTAVETPFSEQMRGLLGLPKAHQIRRHSLGKGAVTLVPGFAEHWTVHSAFLPKNQTYADLPIAAELSYTGAARIILGAAGWQPEKGELREEWFSRFGEPIAGARPGLAFRRWWRVSANGALCDFGVEAVAAEQPLRLADVRLEGGRVVWQPLDGSVQLDVRDADGRLLDRQEVRAGDGRADLRPRSLVTKTCRVRMRLVRDGVVQDECEVPLTVAGPHAPMPVIVWGRQSGSLSERWEYARLRQLGINAVAVVGRRADTSIMAAAAGLRLVPTNVFVPSEKVRADRDGAVKALSDFARVIGPLDPLAWSLADEPAIEDLLAWRKAGADAIHEFDAGARVGYCGVWLRPPKDARAVLQGCDFLEVYSPLHLYTPDIWSGIERDLVRDFRRDDALLTAWTHYVGTRDHEPYARTVPWVWLFDGLDGISYFCSTRQFGVLHDDLTAAPDSRWWSEEVATLARGIAAQLRTLRRPTGQVRVLYDPLTSMAAHWAAAMARANVPYRWVSVADAAKGLDGEVAIVAGHTQLDAGAVEGLGAFAARGGTVVVASTGAWGPDLRGLEIPPPDEAATKRLAGVPVEAVGAALRGRSLGVVGWKLAGGRQEGTFAKIGSAASAQEVPAQLRPLLDTPAVVRNSRGKGQVWSLALEPDESAIMAFLAGLGVAPVPAKVTLEDGKAAPATYIYPLSNGPVQAWGIVQDYNRVDPAWQLADGPVPNQAFVAHGRRRWAARPARLEVPEARHLYDVRRGRYLGFGTSAAFELAPGRPELIAALPYRVTGLTIAAPNEAAAGSLLPVQVTLQATDRPGTHAVHVESGGLAEPVDLLADGKAGVAVPLPLNAGGTFELRVTDALSGLAATHTVRVAGPEGPGGLPAAAGPAVLPNRDLPAGSWVPWQPAPADIAEARVGALSTRPFAQGAYAGQLHLSGGFTLKNSLTTWHAVYRVCNDWQKNNWPDKRMIAAPYPPGLGFDKPVPHIWYFNGYFQVFLDKADLSRYALREIKRIDDPVNARVECVWDTPCGEVVLRSALRPDDPALYQELIVRPTVAFRTLSVRFRSYPAGFDSAGRASIRVEPDARRWAILGDQLRDRAFGQGMGPGAILIRRDELTSWDFGSRTTLARTVEPEAPELLAAPGQEPAAPDTPAPKPARLPEVRLHWCLWAFPDTGNDEVLNYIQTYADVAAKRLIELYQEH